MTMSWLELLGLGVALLLVAPAFLLIGKWFAELLLEFTLEAIIRTISRWRWLRREIWWRSLSREQQCAWEWQHGGRTRWHELMEADKARQLQKMRESHDKTLRAEAERRDRAARAERERVIEEMRRKAEHERMKEYIDERNRVNREARRKGRK